MNIQRQIKKQIYSKEHDFFIISPLNLEDITAKELDLLELKNIITKEGIELKAKINDLYKMNLKLRSASRILMRIYKFKAMYPKELKEKISKVNWALYLKENSSFFLKVSSKNSKLYHSGLIEEVVKNDILRYSLNNKLNFKYSLDENSIKIYVRAENNNFVISLDSSGDNLYKRSYKKITSIAPLRENIASALLLKYWDKKAPLLDPMCGSGTFSLEAYMIRNNISPGINRKFSFMNWNCFREKTFNYIKNEAIKEEKVLNCNDIISSDYNPRLLNTYKNFESFNNLNKPKIKDFFSYTKPFDSGLVVINLPYGKRIKVEKNFYKNIEKKLKKDFKNWNVLLIYPQGRNFNLDGDILKIKNGGLNVNVLYSKL